jgi:hypothetical protein
MNLSQPNLVHILPIYFYLFFHLNFGLPHVLFQKIFSPKCFILFHFVPFCLSRPVHVISFIMYLVTEIHPFQFIQFLLCSSSKSVCISRSLSFTYCSKDTVASDKKKRETKYLSSYERTRITLLRPSRDPTLVRPSSFKSIYISPPIGVYSSVLSLRVTAIHSLEFFLSCLTCVSEHNAPPYQNIWARPMGKDAVQTAH